MVHVDIKYRQVFLLKSKFLHLRLFGYIIVNAQWRRDNLRFGSFPEVIHHKQSNRRPPSQNAWNACS